jgi:hypothetical protein
VNDFGKGGLDLDPVNVSLPVEVRDARFEPFTTLKLQVEV